MAGNSGGIRVRTRKAPELDVPRKRIKVSSAKAKGRALQQWACEQISQLLGVPWGKDEDVVSRGMGQSGVDVKLSKAVRHLFPYDVECKAQESWALPQWIRQAKQNNTEPGRHWLLVVKRSREKAVVVIDAEVFFDLLRKHHDIAD
jgi:hypothetical protein